MTASKRQADTMTAAELVAAAECAASYPAGYGYEWFSVLEAKVDSHTFESLLKDPHTQGKG